jgi:precorrin-2 dehydrogenase/sirohydrochlorin ferrochelatase
MSKSNPYYPICLDMTGRRCVVIGGGAVAERKVAGLLSAGAAVSVISPKLTKQLFDWVKSGTIKHESRNYLSGDLVGYEVAFVATDDAGVDAAIYEEGRSRGIWVNVADDPRQCDFILPAVLRRGDLVVAVATGGKSPALSRWIRDELEDYFPVNLEALVDVAAKVRAELRRRSISRSYEIWRKALDGDVRAHIERGELTQAKDLLLKELGAELCT